MHVEIIPSLCAGTDLDIANAARRTFNKQNDEFSDKDGRLVHFLAKEGHMLPFRHPQLSFACEAPIYVARQLGKHQVGLSWSEVSRRYKTDGITFFQPDHYRYDCKDRKQGTGSDVSDELNQSVQNLVETHQRRSYELYELLIQGIGIAPEQARGVLPQDMEIVWTWTGSLLAWSHLWHLRHHKDTQKETRQFVEMLAPQIRERFPVAWEALTTR
jgi:thymidylate synthase (FAD)